MQVFVKALCRLELLVGVFLQPVREHVCLPICRVGILCVSVRARACGPDTVCVRVGENSNICSCYVPDVIRSQDGCHGCCTIWNPLDFLSTLTEL